MLMSAALFSPGRQPRDARAPLVQPLSKFERCGVGLIDAPVGRGRAARAAGSDAGQTERGLTIKGLAKICRAPAPSLRRRRRRAMLEQEEEEGAPSAWRVASAVAAVRLNSAEGDGLGAGAVYAPPGSSCRVALSISFGPSDALLKLGPPRGAPRPPSRSYRRAAARRRALGSVAASAVAVLDELAPLRLSSPRWTAKARRAEAAVEPDVQVDERRHVHGEQFSAAYAAVVSRASRRSASRTPAPASRLWRRLDRQHRRCARACATTAGRRRAVHERPMKVNDVVSCAAAAGARARLRRPVYHEAGTVEWVGDVVVGHVLGEAAPRRRAAPDYRSSGEAPWVRVSLSSPAYGVAAGVTACASHSRIFATHTFSAVVHAGRSARRCPPRCADSSEKNTVGAGDGGRRCRRPARG